MPPLPDDPGDPGFVIYFILSSISIIANSLVVWSLKKLRRSSSCFTYLLYYLHFTYVLEQILTMPFLFKGNYTFCTIVQSFQCYFGLMNILVVALLVEAHLTTIFDDPYDLKTKIVLYGKYVFYCVPLIGFLGFVNNTFTYPHSAFCIVPSALTSLTFLFFYYVEIWLLLLYTSIRMIFSFCKIYQMDRLLAHKYFSSIGWYIIVAILSWLPRSIIRFSFPFAEDDDDNGDDNAEANTLFLGSFYPMILSGLAFAYIYFREKASIKTFALYNRRTEEVSLDGEYFSWEEVLNETRASNVSHSVQRESAIIKSAQMSVFRDTLDREAMKEEFANSPSVAEKHTSNRIIASIQQQQSAVPMSNETSSPIHNVDSTEMT